jgi:cyclopropane-fatty-acyl-phospholipid synthase
MSQKQVDAAKRIVARVAREVNADLSLELWTGEVLPLGATARDDIRLRIASPDAVRRLLFKPKLLTVFELYATGDIDVVGGSPMEAMRRWDHLQVLKAAKSLNKWALAKDLLPFLLGGKGAGRLTKGEAYDTTKIAAKADAGRKDMELIQFHYDVSNRFYGLFLDPEMVYSSAYFQDDNTSLEDAQLAKLDMICKRLRLKQGDHMLDVGCGWGALICHAVAKYGVTAHGVTLSKAQFDFVTEKINRLGIADKIKLELKDYREIEGEEVYDKIAQIEMFEHLGIDNHDRHFLFMHKLLKPRGLYLHQASTRRATRDISKFRSPTAYQDVITRYIFPGGELDHIGMTVTNLERLGFEVHDVEGWREHFQKTCRLWAERLYARKDEAIAEIGWPRTRLWLLYFALFSVAFERGTTCVFQTLASKRRTGASGLPWTRRDLYR